MKKGIVVTTSPHTAHFAQECLASLESAGYPIVMVNNDPNYGSNGLQIALDNGNFKIYVNDWNGFELGGILRGAEEFDEFIHIMDTCIIDDPSMFEKMFAHDGGVHLCRGYFSYLGKYKSDIVKKIGVPRITTKAEAIAQEVEWNQKYLKEDKNAIQFEPELPVTTDVFEERHGRTNMVLKNGYITKYKGTWK